MMGESLAIVAVILIMSFMFLRAKKRIFALLVLPLTSVPVFYLLFTAFLQIPRFSLSYSARGMAFVTAGLAVAVLGGLLLSRSIPTKRGKSAYLALCIGFPLLLSIAYYLHLAG